MGMPGAFMQPCDFLIEVFPELRAIIGKRTKTGRKTPRL